MPAGMGPAPVSETELRAWQDNRAIRLTPWEAATLRSLSREYVGELLAAEDPERDPPYIGRTNARQLIAAEEMRAGMSRAARL